MALQSYRAELDAVEALLAAKGFGPELYSNQFSHIRNAASPYTLGSEWRGMVGNVASADVQLALSWAAAVLPQTEDELAADELRALAVELEQLSSTIASAPLPPAMQAYASKQVKTLQAALRMYKVRGIAAIHDGVEQAFGAGQKAREALAAEAATAPEAASLVQKVNGVIERTMVACDGADRINKGSTALLSMAKGVRHLLDWSQSG